VCLGATRKSIDESPKQIILHPGGLFVPIGFGFGIGNGIGIGSDDQRSLPVLNFIVAVVIAIVVVMAFAVVVDVVTVVVIVSINVIVFVSETVMFDVVVIGKVVAADLECAYWAALLVIDSCDCVFF